MTHDTNDDTHHKLNNSQGKDEKPPPGVIRAAAEGGKLGWMGYAAMGDTSTTGVLTSETPAAASVVATSGVDTVADGLLT